MFTPMALTSINTCFIHRMKLLSHLIRLMKSSVQAHFAHIIPLSPTPKPHIMKLVIKINRSIAPIPCQNEHFVIARDAEVAKMIIRTSAVIVTQS